MARPKRKISEGEAALDESLANGSYKEPMSMNEYERKMMNKLGLSTAANKEPEEEVMTTKFTGEIKLKSIQLRDLVHLQMEGSGRTFHQVLNATDKLSITWLVDSNMIHLVDPKDDKLVPMANVIAFKIA